MAKNVDEKLQDANFLKETSTKYKTEMAEAGFNDELADDFNNRILSVTAKDTAYKQAINLIRQKTVEQNDTSQQSLAAIKIVKDAGMDVYYGHPDVIAEFHPGLTINTVKAMLTELPYFIELTARRMEKLSEAGIGQPHADELSRCYSLVQTIDSAQENAKRMRNTARNELKETLANLQEMMYRIRKKAAVRFANNADIRNEFRTIIVRRRKKAEGESEQETEE